MIASTNEIVVFLVMLEAALLVVVLEMMMASSRWSIGRGAIDIQARGVARVGRESRAERVLERRVLVEVWRQIGERRESLASTAESLEDLEVGGCRRAPRQRDRHVAARVSRAALV